jgi:DNA polymerase IV
MNSQEKTPGRPPRSILLLDCDAFFVQVARQVDPEGAGRAPYLVVGGRGGRGVVTSASYEARAHGVRSGMPMAEALRRCPEALAVPVPREACTGASRAIRETLETLSPVVEAASIDEFYLDLTGTERLFGGAPLEVTAHRIREAVQKATGISTSLGGGTNRLVAKLAAGRAKPAGVHVVPPGREAEFMAAFPLGALPGVGPAQVALLEARGLHSVPELLAVEPEWLIRWFGARRAEWLRNRAMGLDSTPVTPDEDRKSISGERTFAADIPPGPEGDAELEGRLLELVGSVGATLRRQRLRARTITVKIRDADFTTHQRSRTLEAPVESDGAIDRTARSLLGDLRQRRRPTRLLGVGVSGLVTEDTSEAVQLDLLDALEGTVPPRPEAPAPESSRDRTLSRLSDDLRARFGEGAIRPGRILGDP